MFRIVFASLLLVAGLGTMANAQTRPRKKAAPYSVRTARKAPAVKINPHTGKPMGAGVAPELRDGSAYLAPSMPMRRQSGYKGNGGYNDNRPHRAGIKKPAPNSSLNRNNAATRK